MSIDDSGGESYVRVASVEELEEPTLVKVDGRKFLLYRADDEIRAYRNVCPHQYGPVAEGHVEDELVFCPWHGWGFDLNSGLEIHGGIDRPLPQVSTTVKDGNVYLRM